MEKKLLVTGIVLAGMLTSVASFANSSCVPPSVQEGSKYLITYSNRTDRVKVLKLNEGSCWVKVKNVRSSTPDPIMGSATTDSKPFWVNFQNVSSVK